MDILNYVNRAYRKRIFTRQIWMSVGVRPALSDAGIGGQGDGIGDGAFHFLFEDARRGVRVGLGALDDQLVVDLQEELCRRQLPAQAAAVPWMGMFRATRSPKERRLKFEDLSSGRYRRRPKRVET